VPFIALCPHCRSAKVQAPSRKRGTLHTCPKCSESFALEPADEASAIIDYKLPPVDFNLDEAYRETPEDFAAVRTVVHRPVEAPTNPTPSEVLPLPPRVNEVATDYTPDVTRLEPALVLALAAGGVFGLAMIATQFPYGRLIAIPVLIIGGLLALLAVPGLQSRKNYGWGALGVNAFGLLLVTLMPDWLGAGEWKPKADPNAGPKPVLSVGHDGNTVAAGEWIDARNAVWRQDDVQIAIGKVRLEPVDAKAKQLTQRMLRITLKLSNVGVARAVTLNNWNGESLPKLAVANGSAVAFIKMETPGAAVYPGKDLDVVLAFELPPTLTESLTLELPGSAFGGRESVKFRIPSAMISR